MSSRENRGDERENSKFEKFSHKKPVKTVKFYRESLAEQESAADIEEFFHGNGDIFNGDIFASNDQEIS